MITVNQLSKRFGQFMALNIDHLELQPGQSVALAGNNGAGKTTFFRLILDLLEPTSGEVRINQQNVKGSDHWKASTASFLDEGFLIDYLTPDEFFAFVARVYNVPKAEIKPRLERFEPLFNGEILGKRKYIRDLSKGNQKKVGIAAAMLARPDLVLLDEPFANLDPSTCYRLIKLINQFRQEWGTTFFISSHDLNHVVEVCERMLIMDKGQIVLDQPVTSNSLQQLQDYFRREINADANLTLATAETALVEEGAPANARGLATSTDPQHGGQAGADFSAGEHNPLGGGLNGHGSGTAHQHGSPEPGGDGSGFGAGGGGTGGY